MSSESFQAWLAKARAADSLHKAALKGNPYGGNLYNEHVLQIHSGQFWRCAHGLTGCVGRDVNNAGGRIHNAPRF